MITMQAPHSHYEHYTRRNLYRADAKGRLQRVVPVNQVQGRSLREDLTYEIDGRDLADLRAGGCVETFYDTNQDLIHVNEANVRLGQPMVTSPLVPATEEEASSPSGEAVREPEQREEEEEAPAAQTEAKLVASAVSGAQDAQDAQGAAKQSLQRQRPRQQQLEGSK